jgi:hypothetical protein
MIGLGDVQKLVRSAKQMRSHLVKQDREGQHRELAMVYHAALFLKKNSELWKPFCVEVGIAQCRPSPATVLRAVLREYTGNDKSGIKSASRYFRAFILEFDRETPANTIYERLTCKGGVDALLLARTASLAQTKPTRVEKRQATFKIDHEGEYRASLQGGSVRPVVLAVQKPGHWLFRLIVTKAPNAKQTELHEIED